jgi:hypothetical protein
MATLTAGSLIYFAPDNSEHASPQFSTPAAAQAWEAAQPHFKTAEEATAAAAEHTVQRVRAYFDKLLLDGRLGGFADEALSWTAKLTLITNGQEPFNAYITERFETLVFSERDLNALVTEGMTIYAHEVDAADNTLLLAIQTDTEAQAGGLSTSLPTAEQIHERFAEVIQQAQASSSADLPNALARETITIVVTEVLTQCAAQALTSAGILGTGTATGAVTFGVGILAGVAVDFVVQKVTAPQEQLAIQLREKLAGVRDSTVASTRAYLEELGRRRSEVRRQVVVQALGGSL